MISIRYPGMPQGVDAGSIIDAFNSSHDRAEQQRNEAQAKSVLERYANSLYGGGQPQTLSSLQGMFQPAAPAGNVTRSPLAPVADYPSQRVAQAFGDPGAPAVAGQGGDLNSNSIAGRFLKTVRDGGVSNPFALAAIAATGKAESGFDPKNATRVWSDPSQSGQAGTAGGIMSWRNERLRNLQAFAQQNGDDPNAPSPETQARFLLSEDPSLIQKLQQAKSPQEAQQLMNNAWRFAGYDQAGGEAGRRMESANAYAQEFGGSPSQQALEGLAVGQSMPAGQGVQVADASGAVPAMPQGDASLLLPPREVMAAMFANPVTRPLAAQLAQSVIKMRAGQADPQTQLEYQIAVEKLRQLRDPKSKLINSKQGIYDPNTGEWIAPPEGAGNLETGLQPQMMRNPKTGETIYVQPTKDGRLLKSQVPDGFEPYDPYEKSFQTKRGQVEGETQGNRVQAQTSLKSTFSSLDRLAESAKDLANDPSLGRITGWTGMIPNAPGGKAASAQARLNTLKTQVGFTVLQAMRDASKTGGALGAISDRENDMLQNALAALDQAQSEDDLKNELTKIVQYVADAKTRLQAGYDETYGGNKASPKGNRTSSGVQWSIDE